MEFLKNLARGVVIGIAEVIPGVSGGTMAVLMNIYDRLIGSISGLRQNFKKNVLFLLPLVLGMGAAILAFSHVIKFLLANYPMAVNFFFLGLVLGIVPMLYKKAMQTKFNPLNLTAFAATLAIMIGLAIYSANSGQSADIISTMSAGTFFRFLAIGFLAAVCLILPGISGSMIMVIFGIYDSVITAVSELNIIMLIPVGIGILCGLLFGAKLINYCLKHFPQATYFAILGLVLGSTVSLFQRSGFVFMSASGAVSLVTFAVGIGVSLLFASDKLLNKPSKNNHSPE